MLARPDAARCRGPTAPAAAGAGPTGRSRRAARPRAPSRASAPRRAARRRTARRSARAAIASSSTGVCSRLRDSPVSRTRPASIASCTEATTSRRRPRPRAGRGTRAPRGSRGPVAICSSGNGSGAGANAFSASRSSTAESLPPLNSSAGRSRSAATSRMMWIASDSSASRWASAGRPMRWPSAARGRHVQAALGLLEARPAALAARARLRAVRAADRGVAPVVQRVVRQVALA